MPKKVAPTFYFIGNHPVLDYINTKIAVGGRPVDLLDGFPALLDWLCKAGLLGKEQALECERSWGEAGAAELVADAIALRGDLLSMIQLAKSDEPIPDSLLVRLNGLVGDRSEKRKLVWSDHAFRVEKQLTLQRPGDLLLPIAEAALEFFGRNELSLVRKCGNPDCVLYFYDNSKNGTRRWCSQKTCGNRMKVTAYMERRRNRTEP